MLRFVLFILTPLMPIALLATYVLCMYVQVNPHSCKVYLVLFSRQIVDIVVQGGEASCPAALMGYKFAKKNVNYIVLTRQRCRSTQSLEVTAHYGFVCVCVNERAFEPQCTLHLLEWCEHRAHRSSHPIMILPEFSARHIGQ